MIYSKEVMDHFKSPRNMGELKKANGIGTVGNPKCGDVMKLYIIVESRKTKDGGAEDYISDIKFQTLGCGAAIACSSVTTELVKGKSIKEALKITNKNVADTLGNLPKEKFHCSILAEQAIKSAIEDYVSRQDGKQVSG